MTEIITTQDKLACAERELKMRKCAYDKWVDQKKMSAGKAAHEIAAMSAIVDDYRRERKMLTNEGRVKKQIRDWLREQGAYIFSPVQQGYGASTLDILVCWKGQFVGIEVKAEGKMPTHRQMKICEEIEQARGQTIIAWKLLDVTQRLI